MNARLGIDLAEWPPQRLDWEIYKIEHLAFVRYMESTWEGWLSAPWHIGLVALRTMACLDWSAQHACPVCSQGGRNNKAVKDPWNFISGCMDHLMTATSCYGIV